MENSEYYVYLYKDLDGTPVYVGKGKGDRAFQHLKHSSNDRLNKWISSRSSESHHIQPEIVAHGSEDNMLMIETALIQFFGRADLAKGPLFNNTDGGDGVSNPSEAIRRRMSEAAFARHGGERLFRFRHYETGEIFEGNCPEFGKYIGKDVRAVNKLISDIDIHSVGGWVLDGSDVKPNQYRKEFEFYHLGTGENLKATQAGFCEATGLSASLANQIVNEAVQHGNGWVLSSKKDTVDRVVQNSRGKWYTPPKPWRVAGLSKKALATWAMACNIRDAWLHLSSIDPDIRAKRLLRSIGMLDELSERIVDNIIGKLRDGFDPLTSQDWVNFSSEYAKEYSLPIYSRPDGIIDGRSKHLIRSPEELHPAPKETAPHSKSVTIDGVEYGSISEAARSFGIEPSLLGARLRKGYTPEQAAGLVPPPEKSTPYNAESLVVGDREFQSLTAAAKAFDIPPQQIHKRIKQLGWTVEEAFELVDRKGVPSNHAKKVVVDGVTYNSIRDASAAYGLSQSTVNRRVKGGMSLEDALKTPSRNKSKS